MKHPKRIGIGIDLDGEEPTFAARSGAALARRCEAAVDLVHVVSLPPLYSQILTPIQSQIAEPDDMVRRIVEKLQELAASPLFAGLEVATHAPVGAPHALLVECCRAQQDDLIVVGAHRRGAVERLLLGRTGERVLRYSPVPVLVARSALAEDPPVILTATDFSPASRTAIEESLALARGWNSRVVMVHVMEPVAEVYGWAADLTDGDIYLAEPKDLEPEWEKLTAGLDTTGVEYEHRTEQGDPARVIADLAGELGAELIVVGTHGRSAIGHALLGSVAEGVARRAEKSVLTIPSRGALFSIA